MERGIRELRRVCSDLQCGVVWKPFRNEQGRVSGIGDETMNPDEFVTQVRNSVVDEGAETYRVLLETTPIADATDPHWRALLGLYGRLPEADRKILRDVVRQVAVGTVSSLFGIIDGSSSMEGQTKGFELLCPKSRRRLDGSLQDLFLEMEELDSDDR